MEDELYYKPNINLLDQDDWDKEKLEEFIEWYIKTDDVEQIDVDRVDKYIDETMDLFRLLVGTYMHHTVHYRILMELSGCMRIVFSKQRAPKGHSLYKYDKIKIDERVPVLCNVFKDFRVLKDRNMWWKV